MKEKEIQKTTQTYNEFAEEYFEVTRANDGIKHLLDSFVKKLEKVKGKRVLDAGCGTGRDAKYFSELGLEVVGVDLSEKLLEIAKDNAKKAEFYLMDMRKLVFKENSFDGLWACASFLHIPKKDAKITLERFHRVLKPEGMMYMSVKEGEGEKLVKSSLYGNKERFFAFYTLPELRELVQDAGFETIEELVEEKKDGKTTWLNIFAKAKKIKT